MSIGHCRQPAISFYGETQKTPRPLVTCTSKSCRHALAPNLPNAAADFWATICKTVCPRCYRTVVLSCPLSATLVYCGQTAGSYKMPLGTEVGLGLGDTVLDGDPAPPWKGTQQPPTFRAMSIVAKRSPISATAQLLSGFSLRRTRR